MGGVTVEDARIGIIGAGPGGLVCARILQRHGIRVTVYDGDADASARNQGGSLDLHEDDGQRALREAGLLEEFFALARFEGQEMRQLDPNGTLLGLHVPEKDETSAPEIDRGQLRQLLLDSLTPGTIRWGHWLASVEGPDDGPRTLVFKDGERVETDLVIGADGAFSRVRRAVSDAAPVYSGVSFLEAWFDDLSTAHPELADLVGGGSAMVSDGERTLFAQRNANDHMRVYIVRRVALDWMRGAGLTPTDTAGIRRAVLPEFAAWAPALRAMVTDNDGPYVDRPLWVLPAPHVWDHSATVALLGDAAHLVPPVGVGVNMAMLDASELALALVHAETVDEAVRVYEGSMLPRATELAISLDGQADFLLSIDGPEELEAATGTHA